MVWWTKGEIILDNYTACINVDKIVRCAANAVCAAAAADDDDKDDDDDDDDDDVDDTGNANNKHKHFAFLVLKVISRGCVCVWYNSTFCTSSSSNVVLLVMCVKM